LETLVLSLDRIGSEHPERPALDKALTDFMLDWHVFGRLATARRLLFDAWTASGRSEEALIQALQSAEYWADGQRPSE